jgi:biopolymer transport protein ExbB
MDSAIDIVWKIWSDGGWLMLPLALLGMFIYTTILDIYFYLNSLLAKQDDRDLWAHWVDKPEEAEGPIGEMVRHVQEDLHTSSDIRRRVLQLKQVHLSRIDSRIRMAVVLVSTAPLTGLLGTVTGMLSTFAGLGASSGGNTIDLVAGGISEALITTQTGLVLAIPGYILIHMVKRKRERLEIFLNQLEILTMQSFERHFKQRAS